MYLICLNTNDSDGIVEKFVNCKQKFEISIEYGVPAPPPDGPGGAISFWPGALVGTSNGYDWLFQPLLTQGEFNDGWQAVPAVWIQNPDGSTAAQLGWADGVVKPGSTMFVPRPGDLITSSIKYDKATSVWEQSMTDVTTGEFFHFLITAGNTYRNEYVCPDNTLFELIYFTLECGFEPSKRNIWQNNIDAYTTFTIDGSPHNQNFTDKVKWTGEVYSGISSLSLNLLENQFTMNLPSETNAKA